MQDWELLGRKDIFENPVLGLIQERIRTPAGDETDWTVIEIGDGAAVLAVEDDGAVHMIRQYRHAVGEAVWELPAGRVEPEESPLAAARRELAEEAGLTASSFEEIGFLWPLDGVCRHRIHLFVARGLNPCATGHETFEDIECRRIDRSRLEAMIGNGELRCGIALAALARSGWIGGDSS